MAKKIQIESGIGALGAEPERPLLGSDLLNDMFGIIGAAVKRREICSLPLEKLRPWHNPYFDRPQPFRPYPPDKFAELMESMGQNGLLEPVIVRPCDGGGYEILAGHNRTHAACELGWKEIDCIVVNASTEDAAKYMVDPISSVMKYSQAKKHGRIGLKWKPPSDRLADLKIIRLKLRRIIERMKRWHWKAVKVEPQYSVIFA